VFLKRRESGGEDTRPGKKSRKGKARTDNSEGIYNLAQTDPEERSNEGNPILTAPAGS